MFEAQARVGWNVEDLFFFFFRLNAKAIRVSFTAHFRKKRKNKENRNYYSSITNFSL